MNSNTLLQERDSYRDNYKEADTYRHKRFNSRGAADKAVGHRASRTGGESHVTGANNMYKNMTRTREVR